MNQSATARPNGCLARAVMALVLLTALITLAAVALFLIAVLPIPESLRPWVGLGLFIAAGVVVVVILLRRARSGDASVQQHLELLFGPLGLSLQENGDLAGTYAGVYRGYDLRTAYAISGTPQRPTYHLEIALHRDTPLRLAIGMTKFRLQFDEERFGQPLLLTDPDYAALVVFTDDPDRTQTLLSMLDAQQAILDLLSPDAPGVRNLTLADGAFSLRYRHLSLKGLNEGLVRAWIDDLVTVIEMSEQIDSSRSD